MMRYAMTFLLLFSIISTANATELSDALTEGKKLGWDHKDTYRPYPILFVHGLGGHCVGWLDPDNSNNYQGPDEDDGMVAKLMPYFKPYWKKPFEEEKFSDKLLDITLSNNKPAKIYDKTYLETVEFSDNNASIHDLTGELQSRILGENSLGDRKPADAEHPKEHTPVPGYEPLLREYYHPIYGLDKPYNPTDHPQDKVILVAHSAGGVFSRNYLTNPAISQDFKDRHIDRLIMISAPNFGAPIAERVNNIGICNISGAALMGGFIGGAFGEIPGVAAGMLGGAGVQAAKDTTAGIICAIIGVDPYGKLIKDLKPDSDALLELNKRSKPQDVTQQTMVAETKDIMGIGAKSLIACLTGFETPEETKRLCKGKLDETSQKIDEALKEAEPNSEMHTKLSDLKLLIDRLISIPMTTKNSNLICSKIAELKQGNVAIGQYIKTMTNNLKANKVKTLSSLLKNVNLSLTIVIPILSAIIDKSDGMVPVCSQAYLTGLGGQIAPEESSEIVESSFHSTAFLGPIGIRGSYDGKISVQDIFSQIAAHQNVS